MSFAIFSIYLLSLASAFLLGNTAAAGAAVLEGAADALRFAMELAGALCLWSAVTELLECGGAADALARFLRVPLRALFPRGFCDQDTRAALTENLSARCGEGASSAGGGQHRVYTAPADDGGLCAGLSRQRRAL